MQVKMRQSVTGESGQMLIFSMVFIFVSMLVGVVVIDAGLWHSQRRVAQGEADAAAFAGGQELFKRTTAADISDRAAQAATQWADRNLGSDENLTNSTPKAGANCFGAPSFDGLPDSLTVDMQSSGGTLFSKFWDIAAPNVGAHAKVCIGSPSDAEQMLPFGIQIKVSKCFKADGTPLFGQQCNVVVRAPDGSSGETGTLKLFNDGRLDCSASNVGATNKTLFDQIVGGANTTCGIAPTNGNASNCQILVDNIGTCVWSDTGNKAGTIVDALQMRLSLEGQKAAPYNCDDLYPDSVFGAKTVRDKVDQWWEVLYPLGFEIHSIVPGPGVFFQRRDCTSPRLVTIILIDQFEGTGQCPCLIRGFAGFYITGCGDEDGNVNQRCVTYQAAKSGCDATGGGKGKGCPNPTGEPLLKNAGQLTMQGMFINYVDLGQRGGPLTKFGRAQLYLVE